MLRGVDAVGANERVRRTGVEGADKYIISVMSNQIHGNEM